MDNKIEWLEADGLGGFASGTATGTRTRRYHALLLTARRPPADRMVLVNGYDAWVETPAGSFAITSQAYLPDVLHPDGRQRLEKFAAEPWPQWTYRLEDGTRVGHVLFVKRGAAVVALLWYLIEPRPDVKLSLRPFLSGRDAHALHRENPAFRFDATVDGNRVRWQPYAGVPAVTAFSNGVYTHAPDWYRNFFYEEERARGLDHVEDLASPGSFRWDLSAGWAGLVLAAEGHEAALPAPGTRPEGFLDALGAEERKRRDRFPTPLHRAADAYVVRRGDGKTIVAGYPWFTDWGRDTFVSLRGLCLATGRLEDAWDVLGTWAGAMSEGMIPNRFPDAGETPDYASVDASLWFVIAAHEYLRAARNLSAGGRKVLCDAIEAVLAGYTRGTRHGIRVDEDGLLAAGEPGRQLTWMDAKVGTWVVTPRIGKPVEVEALWLNALRVGAEIAPHWREAFDRGLMAFQTRFWNEGKGCLHDVVDVNHERGAVDATFRPNQVFAVGGLPFALLDWKQAGRLVDAVEERLWTPLGLSTLAPGESGYVGRYQGGTRERDAAYHQGTVWPWLLGPFVEAWVRVHGDTASARRQARERFLAPLLERMEGTGVRHLPEVADGDAPHTSRGCPFQAWSLAEVLRLQLVVLAEPKEPGGAAGR